VPAPTVHTTARLTPAVCTGAAYPATSSPDHAETSSLFWVPGAYAPAWSEKHNSFVRLCKKKGGVPQLS
jgi:hypothetical protein